MLVINDFCRMLEVKPEIQNKEQIPEGYKKTNIGVIPEDWEVRKLGEVCDVNPAKPKKPNNGKVSFLSMDNVSEDAKIINLQEKMFDEVKSGFTSFANKDVLIAKITPCFENGKGAFADNLINGIGFGTTEFHVLRSKKNITPYFVYYFSNSYEFRLKCCMNMQGSSGHKRVSTNFIKLYCIPIPPLKEQQKIAAILTTWDTAIEQTQTLLSHSKQQKKYLMQQLLTGKQRLLDQNGKRFCGVWEVRKLGEVFNFKKGKGLSKSVLDFNGKYQCVLYGELYTKYKEVISDVFSRTNIFDGILSNINDILIPASTTTNGIDLANVTVINQDGVLLGGDINILRPKILVSSIFIAYLLTHVKKYEIASLAQGTTIVHLYGSAIKKIKVNLPPLPEQQKIATVLTAADQEIEQLEQQIINYKQEKKYLMQQLLTGKTRVVLQ